MFNNFILNHVFYGIIWKKYCRTGQVTDDNMAHVPYMLDIKGYKHTL